MEETIALIQSLFKNNSKKRFITDESGNVYWQNFDANKIVFYYGIKEFTKEGAALTAYIDDVPCSVECTLTKNLEDITLYLWTVYSVEELLTMFGSTDSYYKVVKCVAETENTLERLLKYCVEVTKSKDKQTAIIGHVQKQISNELLRQVEACYELISAIFIKGDKSRSFTLYEQLIEALKECEAYLKGEGLTFMLEFTDKAKTVQIAGNKRRLNVLIMIIVKLLILNSAGTHITIYGRVDFSYIQVHIDYFQNPYAKTEDLFQDFELFCAKMYTEYLGGKIRMEAKEDKRYIEIELPVVKDNRLNTSREFLDTPTSKTVEIFLDGIKRNTQESNI